MALPETNPRSGPRRPRGGSRRSAARLGAIQALYQIELTGQPAESVVREFLAHRLEEEIEGLRLGDIDQVFFARLVTEVAREAPQLDDMLSAVLAEGWPVERLETLLKLILRAGAYELGYREDVPARAIIAEYVDLAHAFLSGKEPAMANGVLDRLARQLRPGDFAPDADADPADGG
ncbi:MAG: transcription antitermination factor NusB [Kiloniellales bacterium]